MPLTRDSRLWWNMAGAVACYQPVRAPGPLLARYNMRAGGTNAYQAVPGVMPTFNRLTGWTFASASAQCLNTGVVPYAGYSMIIRFSGAGSGQVIAGVRESGDDTRFQFAASDPVSTTRVSYGYGPNYTGSSAVTEGVLCLAGPSGYLNGIIDASSMGPFAAITYSIYIGKRNGPLDSFPYNGNVQSFAIYSRTLSAAEVWQASRQMAYCDVNPDWNVWAPRRKWFYSPAVAAAISWRTVGNTFVRGRS